MLMVALIDVGLGLWPLVCLACRHGRSVRRLELGFGGARAVWVCAKIGLSLVDVVVLICDDLVPVVL